MKIIAVGDIMPGGILSGIESGYVSQEVLNVLKQGDVRVGTLETAIGNEPTCYEEKMKRKADVIYAKDSDLKKLVDLGINIVSLANNHFFDLGPEGAVHTIELLDKLGIEHIGAGRNLEEASKPVVKWFDGMSVAFLAFCDWHEETVGWCPFATDNAPGVNPMYDDYVTEEIQKYKNKYDFVIVMPHWGKEYRVLPMKEVYKMAKGMINAGADLILGGHTHSIQPVWTYKNKSVVFSMGNFLFPDRLITKPRSTYYPESPINVLSLPTTEGYPYVETVTYKKWKGMARYGQIVQIAFEYDGISVLRSYTHLREGNYLEATKRYPYKNRVDIITLIMSLKLYPFIEKLNTVGVLLKKSIVKVLCYAKRIKQNL